MGEDQKLENSNYKKYDKAKEYAAKRAEALDNILGEEKHNRFSQYLRKKLEEKYE